MSYYIGLMSGTSFDAIDAVLVDFKFNKININASYKLYLPENFRNLLIKASQTDYIFIDEWYALDIQLSNFFVESVKGLLAKTPTILPKDIVAIGCHGQTLRHNPNNSPPYTVQLGDPNLLAVKTNIPVVADFRRKDIALGGQGAPLTPIFHKKICPSDKNTKVIINIGGMSNISIFKKNNFLGFDTGPGNVLLDYLAKKYWQKPFDKDGKFAAKGEINFHLLEEALNDPFFKKQPPKSTGRELFNPNWLKNLLKKHQVSKPEDLLATMTMLTAKSIALAISIYAKDAKKIYLCGGGAYNNCLKNMLAQQTYKQVLDTKELGIEPLLVEAIAFAWLAKIAVAKKRINMHQITGATKEYTPGGIFIP